MNYNVTFAAKMPQKAVNMGKETIEKIAKDAILLKISDFLYCFNLCKCYFIKDWIF